LADLGLTFADAQIRDDLVSALRLYQSMAQIIRLCLTENFDAKDAPPGLIDLLLNATDLPDFPVLEAHLKETQKAVRKHFNALMKQKR
jgi:glutamate-ammonia-ligase adenylyltransferase